MYFKRKVFYKPWKLYVMKFLIQFKLKYISYVIFFVVFFPKIRISTVLELIYRITLLILIALLYLGTLKKMSYLKFDVDILSLHITREIHKLVHKNWKFNTKHSIELLGS